MELKDAVVGQKKDVFGEDGKSKKVPVRVKDVMSFREYENKFVFVTNDGQKYVIPIAEDEKKAAAEKEAAKKKAAKKDETPPAK